MSLIPFQKTILTVLGVAILGTGAFWWFGSESEPIPELDPLTDLVYSRVADRVAKQVVLPADRRAIYVPHIAGDIDGALRPRINERLRARGANVLMPLNEIQDKSWFGKDAAGDDSWIDWEWVKGLVSKKKEAPAALVLGGRLERIDDEDEMRASLHWLQIDRDQKGVLIPETETSESISKSWFSGDYQKIRIAGSSRISRLGLWIVALVLPALLATPFVRRGLKADSNLTNALMMVGLALPGVIAGWILTAYAAGFWGGTVSFLALVVSGAFAWLYCSILEARR